MGEAACRQRAIRPSSTSKIRARGTSKAPRYRCRESCVLRNFMAWKIAVTPQTPLAMVKRSARWKLRIIEKCLPAVVAAIMVPRFDLSVIALVGVAHREGDQDQDRVVILLGQPDPRRRALQELVGRPVEGIGGDLALSPVSPSPEEGDLGSGYVDRGALGSGNPDEVFTLDAAQAPQTDR